MFVGFDTFLGSEATAPLSFSRASSKSSQRSPPEIASIPKESHSLPVSRQGGKSEAEKPEAHSLPVSRIHSAKPPRSPSPQRIVSEKQPSRPSSKENLAQMETDEIDALVEEELQENEEIEEEIELPLSSKGSERPVSSTSLKIPTSGMKLQSVLV